jgi:uncharacterized membrane protein HdeD (DUF308 family)
MSVSLTSPPVTPAAPADHRGGLRGWVWSALLLSGVAWLAVAWTALRLEPTEVALVAGGVLLFGAVTEVLRAMAGGQTWWLNAGMAALFAATGVLLMIDRDGSMTTPAALVGWYLLVRGAADIVTATLTRATDSTWGLMVVIGVAEAGLGFYSSSSSGRTAGVVIVMVGALALGRGLADLAMALDLRPATAPGGPPADESVKAAGYAAGMTDFAAAQTARPGRARHRAAGAAASALSSTTSSAQQSDEDRAAADLDAMLALAGVSGAAVASSMTYLASAPERGGHAVSGGSHVAAGVAGGGRPSGAPTRTGGTAVGERKAALHSPDGTILARSATMFTGADALEAFDALPSDAYRVPAGPPVASTPTSFAAAPSGAMVQASQVGAVRISPAAAAGATIRTGVVRDGIEPSSGAPADADGPIADGSATAPASLNAGPLNGGPLNAGPLKGSSVNDGPVDGSKNTANQSTANQNTANQGMANRGTGNQSSGNLRGGNMGSGNHAGSTVQEQGPGGTAVRSERLLGRGPGRRRAV